MRLLQDRLNLTAVFIQRDNNSDVASHFASAILAIRIIDNTTRIKRLMSQETFKA